VKPKVSVIIPAYNSEKYIAEAIESVFAQTYPGYEVIVVDDGSTDGTLQLLKRYDSRIKVLTKVNGGPASARNLAINNSCGEYIAFLDSDDLWVEEKLDEQVAFLNKHPEVGLVFGEILIFEERGGKHIILSKNGWTGDPTFRQLLFGNYIPNSTVVIRRRCVDKVGLLNESAELIAVEDHEYWMRIARTFPMAGIPNPLAYYRIREGNILGAGNGYDIDKGLKLAFAAIGEAEKQFPQMWEEYQVDRDLLFARLHIRAGFAWKKRGNWKECMLRFAKAVNFSRNPRVFRWILAATLLSRWS
jgi:glycosyltransferase involved in cell wall biosynthesis